MERPIRHHRNHKRRHVASNHVSETRLLVDLVDNHATLIWKHPLFLFHVFEKGIEATLLLGDCFLTEGWENERFDLRLLLRGLPRNWLWLPESKGNEEGRSYFVRRVAAGEVVAMGEVMASSSSSSASSASAFVSASAFASASSETVSEGLLWCKAE